MESQFRMIKTRNRNCQHCLILVLIELWHLYHLVIAVEASRKMPMLKQVFLHKAHFLLLLSAVPLPASPAETAMPLVPTLYNVVSMGNGHALVRMGLSCVVERSQQHLVLLVP
jgi:hypothetical protein